MADGRRTAIRLADGRELIYFDDLPGLDRSRPDPRRLEPARTASQLRYDPVLDEWVVVAAHRQGRTNLPAADACPLCPGGPDSEIPAAGYHAVAFENRFPSLVGAPVPAPPDGPAGLRPGTGRCEVVCFTDDHDAAFSTLAPRRRATIGRALVDRTEELGRQPGVEYVLCFENRGREIGATLPHPHGQIYAFPFVPPRIARALESARRHRHRSGGCLFCELGAAEEKAGERVVAAAGDFIAFVPTAARWPYEVVIQPRRHLPDLAALGEAELAVLMELYADVLGRFERLFGGEPPAPYIACFLQAPVRADRDLAHLRVQVFTLRRAPDKLKYLAATESGAGVFINDVAPERAAERLRAAGG
ncbi:galactose-1-phosphate uridylyltransferase [Allonocardiopsis opalescens]|uniref:Galactose-1-phosphate uridylyltransferase n=1 Tax=Allonocardiopsis opalescens TaxID=1144618 RepID=A0A2T0PZZ1_9ACTN|nr:galactose-1-phosphate uridylyltransferase [Allonocardiopsis opalescens]PRX97122.1 UDPglucose--hexose-1-phosphate uridylyltransferase [Allonocardiopsis opalescens]